MKITITAGACLHLTVWLALLAASPSFSAQDARSTMPTAATDAVVQAEEAVVFSEMDANSDKSSALKKGQSIYVDLRMDQNGKSWCGVRLSQQTTRIGFVDCRLLVRVGGPPNLSPSSGLPGVPGGSGPSGSVKGEMPLARAAVPTNQNYQSIKRQVIQEDVINSGYIATAEAQAESGGSADVTRAALAHLAAGEFKLSQRDSDAALEHFAAMERYAGRQRDLLLLCLDGRAHALLQKSEYSAALEVIDRERKLSPNSASLAALSGWTHYQMNQNAAAIADLSAAQRMQPQPGTAALLEKISREVRAEDDFREGESSHFTLRYHGGASRQLASEVLHTLEDQFQALRADLHFSPPEPIAVILYTNEVFRDVTQVPGWAGGVNDGRIRIPVQGIDTVTPLLSRILQHELTHSFIFQKSAGRAPTWLQEGIAQWMEGRRSSNAAAPLVAVFQDGKGKGLRYLDGSWVNLSGPQAQYAYAWSLAVVESIVADSGSDALGRLVDAARSEASMPDALREALRTDYGSLDESTIAYLRRTYLQ